MTSPVPLSNPGSIRSDTLDRPDPGPVDSDRPARTARRRPAGTTRPPATEPTPASAQTAASAHLPGSARPAANTLPPASTRPPASARTAPSAGRSRRMPQPVFKAVRTVHIAVSVAWLGVVVAKLVLGAGAVLADDPARAGALFAATGALNGTFPPLAIATLVSGVALALGTRWGILRYYWVATKLALTLAVVVSAVQLTDRLVGWAAPTAPGTPAHVPGELGLTTGTLLGLTAAHLLMLLVATVLSVYRPWGRTAFGRKRHP